MRIGQLRKEEMLCPHRCECILGSTLVTQSLTYSNFGLVFSECPRYAGTVLDWRLNLQQGLKKKRGVLRPLLQDTNQPCSNAHAGHG